MKQSGKLITGDVVQLQGLTKNWTEVAFDPSTFYRNEDEICNSFSNFEDLYATMDIGHSVVIRMNSDKDASTLVTKWNEYL